MNVEMQKRGGQSVPVNPSSAPGREEQNRTGMEGKTRVHTHTQMAFIVHVVTPTYGKGIKS